MPAPPAAPEAAQAKPQPEKAPNNKLQAPPPALDVPAIAAQPQLWPAQIVLLEPTEFPVFVGGKQAGSVRLPRGTSVMLRKVNTDGTVDVQREGATARIPAKCTNLSMAVKNDPPSGNGSASGPTAARPENTPVHLLDVSVSPDADTGADVDEQGTRLRSYRIKIVNATDQKYPKVLVRFFAFARTANDEVILAANDEQSCDIGPNTELTVLPAKLRVVKGRMLEGYAVLLRDAANNIVGSQTTIESVAKNWPALESLPPGAPLP